MIDLHTHSFFSDGVLIPSELFQRARAKGYRVIAVTDHCDASNLELVVPNLTRACDEWNETSNGMLAIPGVELTYVPPSRIENAANQARKLGAKVVLVHGETLVEPVTPDTNKAAIEAGIDILAHPGLVSSELAELAVKNHVAFEITTRKGHSLTNGHVANVAKQIGVRLVINTDSHTPGDLVTRDFALNVAKGCGLTASEFDQMIENAKVIVNNHA